MNAIGAGWLVWRVTEFEEHENFREKLEIQFSRLHSKTEKIVPKKN